MPRLPLAEEPGNDPGSRTAAVRPAVDDEDADQGRWRDPYVTRPHRLVGTVGTDGRVEPHARYSDGTPVTRVQREDLRSHDEVGEEAERHGGDAADADRGLPEPDRR